MSHVACLPRVQCADEVIVGNQSSHVEAECVTVAQCPTPTCAFLVQFGKFHRIAQPGFNCICCLLGKSSHRYLILHGCHHTLCCSCRCIGAPSRMQGSLGGMNSQRTGRRV